MTMAAKTSPAEGINIKALQERVWFLDSEAAAMRAESKRLRGLIRDIKAKRAAKPAKR
jgi:hypothetical protein